VGVTRPKGQAGALSDLLERRQAVPVELPCTELVEPESIEALDAALSSLPGDYDGVLFTSANAVQRTVDRSASARFAGLRIAVAGTATAEALQARGIEPDIVPTQFHSEGILEALDAAHPAGELAGTRWLLPRAETAREVLPSGLRERGARVDVVTAYRAAPTRDSDLLLRRLGDGLAAITFASGAAVEHLRAALGGRFDGLLGGVVVASIGPVTSLACRAAGLAVAVESPRARMGDLVDALEGWFEEAS